MRHSFPHLPLSVIPHPRSANHNGKWSLADGVNVTNGSVTPTEGEKENKGGGGPHPIHPIPQLKEEIQGMSPSAFTTRGRTSQPGEHTYKHAHMHTHRGWADTEVHQPGFGFNNNCLTSSCAIPERRVRVEGDWESCRESREEIERQEKQWSFVSLCNQLLVCFVSRFFHFVIGLSGARREHQSRFAWVLRKAVPAHPAGRFLPSYPCPIHGVVPWALAPSCNIPRALTPAGLNCTPALPTPTKEVARTNPGPRVPISALTNLGCSSPFLADSVSSCAPSLRLHQPLRARSPFPPFLLSSSPFRRRLSHPVKPRFSATSSLLNTSRLVYDSIVDVSLLLSRPIFSSWTSTTCGFGPTKEVPSTIPNACQMKSWTRAPNTKA